MTVYANKKKREEKYIIIYTLKQKGGLDMLHTLAKRMASITLQKSLGEQEKQNVLTYGYELLFSQTFTCFVF